MMDTLLVVTLSRWQFAVTVISHFIFVPTTIGLITVVVIFELLYAFGKKKGRDDYGRLALFFAKIAFFSFGAGIATGLVMELQFGMNWSEYSRFFGDVIGVPIALESLTAFFLEAVLLGLWRFTWGKINPRTHALFGILYLVTAYLSIFWIISVNAFMQNPVGLHMEDGVARLDTVFALLQNPQYLPEVLHVFFGIMILGGFVTAGISAWQILKKRNVEIFKRSVQIGLLIALPFSIVQAMLGDDQGTATGGLQPMKFSAGEARYNNEGSDDTGAPWYLVAWVDEKTQTVYGIEIPGLGSYFGGGKFTGEQEGMNEIAEAYHQEYDETVTASYEGNMDYYPPVALLFWALHIMVLIGYYYAIVSVMATILLHRKKKPIEEHPRILRALGITMWFPYVTLICGWIFAEVGRFPFVVYGLLTQLDAVSPNMTVGNISTSLTLFILIDLALIVMMIIMSHRTMKAGAPDLADYFSYSTPSDSDNPDSDNPGSGNPDSDNPDFFSLEVKNYG